MFCVCHRQSVSVIDNLCWSQTVSICHRQSVCHRQYVSVTDNLCGHRQYVSVASRMCLSQTVCVRPRIFLCHKQSVFVTHNLCLSQTVDVCHRKSVSVRESLCLSQTVYVFLVHFFLSQTVCVCQRAGSKFLLYRIKAVVPNQSKICSSLLMCIKNPFILILEYPYQKGDMPVTLE